MEKFQCGFFCCLNTKSNRDGGSQQTIAPILTPLMNIQLFSSGIL